MTKPAKTARQKVTPRPVKKAASASWRVEHPTVGIRQEIEGHAIAATRRGLFGRRSDSLAKYAEHAVLEGWRPEPVPFDRVPVLCDCTQFHEIEAERVTAIERLGRGGTEADLVVLRFVVWARTAQLDLVSKLAELIAAEPNPTDPDYVRFISWARWWPTTTVAEVKNWLARAAPIESALGPANVELVEARVSRRVDELLARTVPGYRA